MSKTKEGIEVKPGQVWEDMDLRQEGRKVLVLTTSDGYAYVQGYAGGAAIGRRTRLSIKRMHKHSIGWKLIRNAP